MSAAAKSQGQAMYVVSKDDRLWLLNAQRKLHAQSREHPSYVFEKLWGLVTDPRNLRIAFARVNRNRGRRTGGIDRVTVHHVLQSGVDTFLQQIREELRAGTFRPSPVRRVLIPKATSQPACACAPTRSLGSEPRTFASTSAESPVRNERRTPGSVRGVRKPARGKSARPTESE